MLPKEIAEKVIEINEKRASFSAMKLVVLGMLAGVYIGFGAQLCTMVTHDLAGHMGLGFAKFIGGSVFSVGLMLVVIAGAELFTGNNLMLMGVFNKTIFTKDLIRNWFIVYLSNFAGSLLLAGIIYYSGVWKTGQFGVGAAALNVAIAKVNLSFMEAFCRGVGCNWLVCLAIWMAMGSENVVGKIFAVYFPIMAFVASGFEHSVANMYFIPIGLFLGGNTDVINAAGLAGIANNLNCNGFILGNLVPVTLGNIVGGAFFVGGAYYLAYVRKNPYA